MQGQHGQQRHFEDLLAEVRAHRDRVRAGQAAVARTEVTGTADGGDIVVRLRGTGQVVEIVIDPVALRRYDATDLGAALTAAINDGVGRLSATTWRRFAPMLTGDAD